MSIKATLQVDSIGLQGDGLSKYNSKRAFIDRALPNERVEAELIESKNGDYRGQITKILEKSEHRVTAQCKYYDDCGGCQFQHVSRNFYNEWKIDSVLQILKRNGLIPSKINEPVFVNESNRRRASFSAIKTKNGLVFGYNQKRSKHVTNIDECMILDADLLTIKHQIQPYLSDILTENKMCDVFIQKADIGVDCVITGSIGVQGEPDVVVRSVAAAMIQETNISRLGWRKNDRQEIDVLLEKSAIVEKMGKLNVKLPPAAFLQPSKEGAKALVDAVVKNIPKNDITKALDLFSGCGTFTGALISLGYDVFAYEADELAVKALKEAGVKNAYRKNLFKNPVSSSTLNDFDVIVLDPPRAGAKNQCLEIANSTVKDVVYVSCNPVSFAKDAKFLVDAGYVFSELTIIDQFTWSSHVEIVAYFRM